MEVPAKTHRSAFAGCVYPCNASRQNERGFALATVLIASMVMLAILVNVLASLNSATLAVLGNRRYQVHAKVAAESGMAMARACLKANSNVAQWTDTSPLRPYTNCLGIPQSGVSQYLHEDTTAGFRTTFSVSAMETRSGGVKRIAATGVTEVLSESGSVFRTYRAPAYLTVAALGSSSLVAYSASPAQMLASPEARREVTLGAVG